jgi:hypothetical protein
MIIKGEDMEINSKEFWENEFKENWTVGIDGRKQTELFAKMAYGVLSPQLKEEFENLDNSFVDYGCALGEGVKNFLYEFQESRKCIGIDISEKAINICKDTWNTWDNNCIPEYDYKFYTDISQVKDKIDLIFTSNTLEHFHNPEEQIKMLLNYTSKFLLVLVPYMQEPTQWHFFKFTDKFFTMIIDKYKLKLRQYTSISPIDNLYSPTHQILVVFEK